MKKVILKIEGMSCSACQNRVEKYLNKQDGVEASVNLVMQEALISYDEKKVTLPDLDRFIKESGYKSLGVYNEKQEHKSDYAKKYLIIFFFVLLLFMYISMSHMFKLPSIPYLNMHDYPINYGISLLIVTIPFIIYGLDILKSGITKLLHGSPNMDSLVTIGIVASFIYSFINLILIIKGNNKLVDDLYFESSAMIIYFIKLGRYIENNSKEKTKESIKELVKITPQSALIKIDDDEKEITIDEVNKGDILICKPGMKVAVDGVIVKGTSHLDESFITGESKPNKKEKGDKVIAGSINLDGYIEYRAEKIGPDSTISEMVRLVVEATNTKAPIGKIADKVSGIFVPMIMIIAFMTLILYLIIGRGINESLISFVTVLVVACPCALGLATPLALVVSIGTSSKKGILIKKSEVIENVNNINMIVFDKTGTLTYGKLAISKIYNYSKYEDKELLSIIASVEHKSTHPISRAFKDFYNPGKRINNFKNMPGMGICAEVENVKTYIGNNKIIKELNIKNKYEKIEKDLTKNGNSILYVIEDNKIIALIGVKDILRENAKETIKKLLTMNKEVMLLSGDNEETVKNIAKEVGIKNVIANVLPSEKEKVIKELKEKGYKIMMVGDGINDAPSLARSDIGVSLSGGTDIAIDSADIILVQDDLSKIVDIYIISKKTMRIIKQNLFWAFIYNLLMIPIAIGLLKPFGISLSPAIASLSMTISSLTVVINSLRLKKIK